MVVGKVKRIWYLRTHFVASFFAVGLFAPVLWMLMDRAPPYTGHVGRIAPEDPRPGDWVSVEWQLKINRVCPGWVQREIVDSQGVICNYDRQPAIRRDQLFSQQRGGYVNTLNRGFPLCARAAPGPAKYRALTCYECNVLQRWWPICQRTPDLDFYIRPRAEEDQR